jgi:DNA mismatch repair protein MutS
LAENISRIQQCAAAVAFLDMLQSLAQAAYENDYVRPVLNTSGIIELKDSRHPVVEKSLKDGFVPNDVLMDRSAKNMLLITGPNMAGKSTYMRQTGLIVLMAHIGSFVPAASANICLTDRIFTRVGASDNLAAGQSTFMVEMNELANILHNATADSLLILDEIGRGTSTIDGLSIAWATIEYIVTSIRANTLFATHYHELVELENLYEKIHNCSVAAREIGREIVFLHKIIDGGTDKSFGIEVARLAGLPEAVITEARARLRKLQENEYTLIEEPAGQTAEGVRELPRALRLLQRADVDNLTPIEALNLIHEVKNERAERQK